MGNPQLLGHHHRHLGEGQRHALLQPRPLPLFKYHGDTSMVTLFLLQGSLQQRPLQLPDDQRDVRPTPSCLHNRSSIGPCGHFSNSHFSNSSNDPCPEERININNINNMDEVVRYMGGPPPPSAQSARNRAPSTTPHL